MELSIADFSRIEWELASERPLIDPPFPSPLIADPTFLFPQHSPDRAWHLYAHSLMGIHHFISHDGYHWQRQGVVVPNGMRPYLYQDDNGYYLLYEKVHHGRFPWQWLPGRRWQSSIEMIHSTDLQQWSQPRELLSPQLAWHSDARYGSSVSNPCLLKVDGEYRLYYSAGLEFIPDCGFCEPRYIGVSRANGIEGPYEPLGEPVLQPDKGHPWCNLAAGAMKVLKAKDGWIAFQNGIYWNAGQEHSGSAIFLLSSRDGISWHSLRPEPILQPSKGWQKSHIYALDVHRNSADGRFYLYFNARSNWHWTRGKERIGLLIGGMGDNGYLQGNSG